MRKVERAQRRAARSRYICQLLAPREVEREQIGAARERRHVGKYGFRKVERLQCRTARRDTSVNSMQNERLSVTSAAQPASAEKSVTERHPPRSSVRSFAQLASAETFVTSRHHLRSSTCSDGQPASADTSVSPRHHERSSVCSSGQPASSDTSLILASTRARLGAEASARAKRPRQRRRTVAARPPRRRILGERATAQCVRCTLARAEPTLLRRKTRPFVFLFGRRAARFALSWKDFARLVRVRRLHGPRTNVAPRKTRSVFGPLAVGASAGLPRPRRRRAAVARPRGRHQTAMARLECAPKNAPLPSLLALELPLSVGPTEASRETAFGLFGGRRAARHRSSAPTPRKPSETFAASPSSRRRHAGARRGRGRPRAAEPRDGAAGRRARGRAARRRLPN